MSPLSRKLELKHQNWHCSKGWLCPESTYSKHPAFHFHPRSLGLLDLHCNGKSWMWFSVWGCKIRSSGKELAAFCHTRPCSWPDEANRFGFDEQLALYPLQPYYACICCSFMLVCLCLFVCLFIIQAYLSLQSHRTGCSPHTEIRSKQGTKYWNQTVKIFLLQKESKSNTSNPKDSTEKAGPFSLFGSSRLLGINRGVLLQKNGAANA